MQDERPSLRGQGLPPTKKNDGDMVILEPGEMYTVYDAKDVLGNLSGDLKMIVEKSARWAGIDCDFVCGLVERYERRLVRWWNDRRHERNGPGEIRAEEGVSGGTLTPGG
jgi:RNA polymerase I-specific transcription initiation factor RRN7